MPNRVKAIERAIAAGAAALLFTFGAATASASGPYDKLNMGELKAILEGGGLKVEESGKTTLKVGQTRIALDGCDADGKCAEIALYRYYSNVHPTIEAVNEWNLKFKIPEASLDADGDLMLETYMTAIGVTDASILDMFRWFDNAADDPYWDAWIADASV